MNFRAYHMILLACIPMFLFLHAGMASIVQETYKTRLRMSFRQENYQKGWIDIKLTCRMGKKLVPVTDAQVEFFHIHDDATKQLEAKNTDDNGNVAFQLPTDLFNRYLAHDTLTFQATFGETDSLSESTVELEIIRGDLEVILDETDTLHQVQARLSYTDADGFKIPIEDVDVKFYVKRYFSLLPVGDPYSLTDEDGHISAKIPEGLPGNPKNNLEIVVRLEDHEMYGTISIDKKTPWGIEPERRNLLSKRALWGTRAKVPYFLLLLANFIIVLTWTMIVYLILQIISINNTGKKTIR